MMCSQMNQAQLFQWINCVSFIVVDMTLYLDTHPDDCEALEFLNHYLELRNEALEVYAEKYYPLVIDTAQNTREWDWVTSPWPWEGEV